MKIYFFLGLELKNVFVAFVDYILIIGDDLGIDNLKKIDYYLSMQTLLNNILQYVDIYSLEKKLRKCKFNKKCFNIVDLEISYKTALKLDHYLWHLNDIDYLKVIKENNRLYARSRRIRKRVKEILNNNDKKYFITLTFNDASLNTDLKTRRKYVQRYLIDRYSNYVANIDFGSLNNREHYHSVCCSNLDIEILKQWNYGFINIEEITLLNDYRLSKYLDKLTNHALKLSNNPIFSRQKKKNYVK